MPQTVFSPATTTLISDRSHLLVKSERYDTLPDMLQRQGSCRHKLTVGHVIDALAPLSVIVANPSAALFAMANPSSALFMTTAVAIDQMHRHGYSCRD